MKFTKFIPAVLAAAAITLSACGGDDPVSPGESNEENVGGNGGGNVSGDMTPEEVKEQVADIASSILDKFNPKDQQEVIEFINYISEVYGDIEFEDDDDFYYAPMRRAGDVYTINIIKEIPTGIYEPQYGYWTKTGNSSDVVFRVTNDRRYGRIEMTLKYSGSQNINANIPYDGTYKITAPKTVEGTLTANGKTMMTDKIEATLNTSSKTLTANETLSFANIKQSIEIKATNSQANATTTLTVGGSQIAQFTGTLNGRNLCDIDKIAQAADDDTLESLFSNANFSGNAINKIFFQGNIKAIGEVLNAYYSEYEYNSNGYGEYSSREEASAACDKAVNLINRNLTASMSFTNGGPTQAVLTAIKDSYNDSYNDYYYGNTYYYGYYEPIFAMKFSDGTTYTDDFFEYGFDALANQWESLIRAYKRLID